MTRVLLVDDQSMIRAGIRMILESTDDLVVVAEAGDGEAAILQARAAKPDVILMDVQMPILDAIEATKRLSREHQRAHHRPDHLRAGRLPLRRVGRRRECLLRLPKNWSTPSAPSPPETHVSNVLSKLSLRDRVQAVIFA